MLEEDVIATLCFPFALVFYVWEMLLSVFQPEQAHESPLWRQTLPVCVLYKGKWNLLLAGASSLWPRRAMNAAQHTES